MAPEIMLFGARIVPTAAAAAEPEKEAAARSAAEKEAAARAAASVVGLPCPRCKSKETKFCYFNNYNVNQPRHFCRGCQRYWTAGGALRNVPVGAGRRKARPPPSDYAADPGFCSPPAPIFQHWLLAGRDGFPSKRPNNGINGIQERIF